MKNRRLNGHEILSLLIASFLFLATACSPAASVSPTLTPTPTVSVTPSSSDTPQPADTATPSATSIPTSTTTPLVPGLGQVIFSENFEDNTFPFNLYGPGHVESGVLVMERGKDYPAKPGMWQTGGIYGINPIPPGTTIVVLFKSSRENVFHIGLHNNIYDNPALGRGFAFNSGYATWGHASGDVTEPLKLWHTHQPSLDTWHYFSVTRTANGDTTAKIWERDNPEAKNEFHEDLGVEWGERDDLTFYIIFLGGTLMIDEYQELR